jgi:SAM-dependent methyltransferase
MAVDELLALTERSQSTHFWFRGFRAFVRPEIVSAAGGRGALRILDCGCGAGHNLELLNPFGDVFGFDVTAGGLALARTRGRPLVRADAVRVPFASGSFDLVASFDMLQHVEDDQQAVGEMARVLKPGGTLVFTAAAMEWLRGDHSEAWQELRRYTRGSAGALAARAGLEVTRASYLFATLFPLMAVARMAQRAVRPFRGPRIDTDISVPPAPINGALSALVGAEATLAPHLSFPFGSSVLVVARKP